MQVNGHIFQPPREWIIEAFYSFVLISSHAPEKIYFLKIRKCRRAFEILWITIWQKCKFSPIYSPIFFFSFSLSLFLIFHTSLFLWGTGRKRKDKKGRKRNEKKKKDLVCFENNFTFKAKQARKKRTRKINCFEKFIRWKKRSTRCYIINTYFGVLYEKPRILSHLNDRIPKGAPEFNFSRIFI